MNEPKIHRTKSGRILTDEETDRLSTEVEKKEYDTEVLKSRRRGRPPMGSGPADVVPVRIDPDLKAAVEARAEADKSSVSDVIREALRRFLDVA